MIYHEGKQVSAIYYAQKVVSMVFNTGRLVWQAIRSCFGTGIWRMDKPWVRDDKWKNNN